MPNPWEFKSPEVLPTMSPTASTEHMSRPFQDVAKPVPLLAECIKMTPDGEGHCVIREPHVSFQLDPAPDPNKLTALTVDPPPDDHESPSRRLSEDFDAESATDDVSEIYLRFATPPSTNVSGSCIAVATATPHTN